MKKESGIDISLNDKASKIAFDYAKKSFNNIKNIKSTTKDGDFSGGFICRGEPLCSPYNDNDSPYDNNINISIASDGIGTKVEIAERLNKYDSLAYDLLAMVCDDLISNFYEPRFVSNILDIDYINLNIVNELMKGLYQASKEAEVIISGGEIAELGSRISGYGENMHFNWAATAIGFSMAKSSVLKKGDKVYALLSNGFRSNGFSLARKILYDNYGKDWHELKLNEYENWGSVLLKPSKIYTPLIKKLIKNGVFIKKIAHITGGGLINNTKRILPDNLKINITNPIKTPKYFIELMKLGSISKEQAELIWNMGYGMIIVTDKLYNFNDYEINWPIQYIGEVTENE